MTGVNLLTHKGGRGGEQRIVQGIGAVGNVFPCFTLGNIVARCLAILTRWNWVVEEVSIS